VARVLNIKLLNIHHYFMVSIAVQLLSKKLTTWLIATTGIYKLKLLQVLACNTNPQYALKSTMFS